MRTTTWGYAPDEALSEEDLLKVKYQGIRPAPGYPSQPDHTEKSTMWSLMSVHEKTGIELSESLSMMPASSVSALVFAHKESQYFAVGQVRSPLAPRRVNSSARARAPPLLTIHTHSHPLTHPCAPQVAKDQVEAYSARKGKDLETMERWLSPILGYERS